MPESDEGPDKAAGPIAPFSCEKYDWWPFAAERNFGRDEAKKANGNFHGESPRLAPRDEGSFIAALMLKTMPLEHPKP